MLAWGTFTAVSYMEVKKKIDEAAASGDDVYMLKVEKPIAVPARPSSSGRRTRSSSTSGTSKATTTTKEAKRAAEVERLRNRLD